MVALQQPLHPVHDPRMDQLLRCSLQPNLHLRTIAVRIGSKRQCPRPDEKSRHRRLQRPSIAVHTLPRLHLVLPYWEGPTDQNRKNHEQTLASPIPQHCPIADHLLRGNPDTSLEVATDAKSCPFARNPLGNLFHGRLHRRLPPSSTDLPGRNRLPAGSLAYSEWRSHQRHPKPPPHRNAVPVRDCRRVPVSWNIPVPIDSYRDRLGPCKKGVRSNRIPD